MHLRERAEEALPAETAYFVKRPVFFAHSNCCCAVLCSIVLCRERGTSVMADIPLQIHTTWLKKGWAIVLHLLCLYRRPHLVGVCLQSADSCACRKRLRDHRSKHSKGEACAHLYAVQFTLSLVSHTLCNRLFVFKLFAQLSMDDKQALVLPLHELLPCLYSSTGSIIA